MLIESMINASGPTNTPVSATPPVAGVPTVGQMPSAPAGIPSAGPATMPPAQPPLNTPGASFAPPSATTPPAAGNAPIGGSSGSSLKKPKKKLPIKMIAGAIVLVLTLIGGITGYLLTQTSQDVRQQAAGDPYSFVCTQSGYTECRNGVVHTCTVPGSPSQPTSETCGAVSCAEQLGNLYDKKVAECTGTWNDTLCTCTPGESLCFNISDQCSSFNLQNCTSNNSSELSFSNVNDCRAALAANGINECTQQEIATCQQLGKTCVYNESLNRGSCEGGSSNDGGGNGGPATNPTPGAGGTGSCAACLGLGGQAERDCYAQCSGTIATGICAGMSAPQCQQACSAAGGTTQICTGSQEAAGTPRAGEFLSCGASATNGCGQVDCLDSSGNLIGFVIDNSQCTEPPTNPPVVTTPQPTPTTTTVASPTPEPTLDPELSSCNGACTASADCADLNHSCQDGVCRLTDYPDSETCTEPDGASPTPVPRQEDTPLECNDPCTSNSDCSSFNHVCHNSRCRLSTNLDNISCREPATQQSSTTELGQINQQPEVPTTLPSAGAADLRNWLLTGLGAVGAGALILLLL